MERKAESPLARVLKQKEWDEIFSCHFGTRHALIESFLLMLYKNGNRPIPGPASMNPIYLTSMVSMQIREYGFRLETAPRDPGRKNDTVDRYQLVRIKK